MVSKRADIENSEVRKLADDIILAQEREIKQMQQMLARLKQERAAQ